MAENLSTLLELCLKRTARLLKTSYWNPELPLCHNPFAFVPSKLVDALIIYVTRISSEEPLLSSDLRLLLTSGRVRKFTFKDEYRRAVNVSRESLQRIFMDLSTSCRNLVAVIIGYVECIRYNRFADSSMVSVALTSLLSGTPNIKHIDSCIEFDISSVLCSCADLEKLVLNFELKNHLYDSLLVNGQKRPHTSLKYLEVDYFMQDCISYLDIALILKYCTELVSVNFDIFRSLRHLHGEDFKNGCLTHKYKIQKCRLGFSDFHLEDVAPSRDDVLMASVTCPYLQALQIIVHDGEAISALKNFHNLTALQIIKSSWISNRRLPDEDYSVRVQSLLEAPKFGHNLKLLSLEGCFTNVDFSSIGSCCPNLEVLNVEYGKKCARSEYSPTSFRKLRFLKLSCCPAIDTLVGMLLSATYLEGLKLWRAEELTDDVFAEIVKKNGLLHLKNLCVFECGLSLYGWQSLAHCLVALENIMINNDDLNFAEIAGVIQKINPRIVIRRP